MVLLLFLIFLFIGLSDYMMLKENYRVEYPLLFYLIFISGICLFLSNDLISILLSLECITFLGYILVGFDKVKRLSASSGIRYLILGSIPSAFLVIGLSFIYYNFGIFAKDALEIISFSLIENSN
jgi:NADH:ubiquinone oxidoreductase subunit 2 (subunit N)